MRSSEEIFAEFAVSYLTEQVHLETMTARQGPLREKGVVTYYVYSKNAEDAIKRLRDQTPIKHPIIEIAGVSPTGRYSDTLVLPIEWKVERSPEMETH